MEWYNASDSGYLKVTKKVVEKVNTKSSKKNVFDHKNSAKLNNENVFLLYENKYGRVIILVAMSAVLSLAFYYNAMDLFMASSSPEDDDIRIPFHISNAINKRSAKRIKLQPRMRSILPNAISAKVRSSSILDNRITEVKSVPSSQITQVKSTLKLSANETLRDKTTSQSDPTSDTDCRMFSCFIYSRCPLKGGFPIYLYDLDVLSNGIDNITAPIREMLSVNNYITSDPEKACLFIVLTELPYQNEEEREALSESYRLINEASLDTLPYWGSDGQNHLLLNLGYGTITKFGSAMIAQTMFKHNQFRPGFDVVLPSCQGWIPWRGEVWSLSPPMKLARRRILLSFQGQVITKMSTQNAKRDQLVTFLQNLERDGVRDLNLQFYCDTVYRLSQKETDDWALCETRERRESTLQKSTFALIIAPSDYSYASTNLLQKRLYEALQSGAIPVILGGDRIRLPFEEVLDWRKVVISLPTARVTDLTFLLRSMADEDILAYRKQGRMLWERYFGTVQSSVDSLLAVIRTRLNIAPQLAKIETNSTFKFHFPEAVPRNKSSEMESNTFKRNFTVGLLDAYEQWNVWRDPFALYPQLPWDPMLTPEARFLNKTVATRFHESCNSQAGDFPVEQFTAVILTYDRKTMLTKAIRIVSQLQFLNKILVICNGPSIPSRKGWPTTVPIVVIHASRNFMSNRFIPFDIIETEAILSLDDDVIPKPWEIRFAFKVWRQHRDQIVGFFGRNFEWNETKGFLYSTPGEKGSYRYCQYRMVLTGAAFIHRYYLWAYWRILPQSMRTFVDELKNCEDIAMNFLVAHIAKKPPIKLMADWIDQNNNSYKKLSLNTSHYRDRNKCVNYFAKVMGYIPLLSTHYRVKTLASIPKITNITTTVAP